MATESVETLAEEQRKEHIRGYFFPGPALRVPPYVPEHLVPFYVVTCADEEELRMARSVEPENVRVRYVLEGN